MIAASQDACAAPDRNDCIRRYECRSPHACRTVDACADALTPAQDLAAFGYGSGHKATGARPTKRKHPVKKAEK